MNPLRLLVRKARRAWQKSAAYKAVARTRLAKRFSSVTPVDASLHRFYSRLLRPGDLCFDVGANFGVRTNILSRLCSRVVAVEPQSACMRVLQRHFGRNPNIHLVKKALGSVPGTAEMMIGDQETVSTLSTSWLDSVRRSGRFEGMNWKHREMVEVTTLDALIKEFGMPSYIKIDVEGYELEVIKGLCSAIPLVSFEFTPELLDVTHECIACLAQLGDIECNYSLGESSFEFNLPNWVTPMELGKELETIRDDITQFGDVFIRTRSRV